MDVSIDKNMIDKDEYPQTAEIEIALRAHARRSLERADAGNTTGTSTIGSSEACMLGGMAMKWRWRAKRKALGKPTDKPNFVCGPVQVCWHKFARYWDVEIREIPMEPGQLFMDAERMLEAVDENTIGVVPTFGVTYTGNFEFPSRCGRARRTARADRVSTSTSTSTRRAAVSSRRSARPISSGISGCRG